MFNVNSEDQEVKARLLKIFNDPLQHSPFALLQLRKQQISNMQLASSALWTYISRHVQSLQSSKQMTQKAGLQIMKAQQMIARLDQFYQSQEQFFKKMKEFDRLITFKSNLTKALNNLKLFFNFKQELQVLPRLLADQKKLNLATKKIIELQQLQQQLSSFNVDQTILKQFTPLQDIRKRLNTKILDYSQNLIELAKGNRGFLQKLGKCLQMIQHSKQPIWPLIQNRIKNKIDSKFNILLSNLAKDQILIDHCGFVITDLMDYIDLVAPLLPKDIPFLEFVCTAYKDNVQQRIEPQLTNTQAQDNHARIINLLAWIDDYQLIMSRVGLSNQQFDSLKQVAKAQLVYFIEHIHRTIGQYTLNAFRSDGGLYFQRDKLETIVDKGEELLSLFPQSLFRSVNTMIQTIINKLHGQSYVEFMRAIAEGMSTQLHQISSSLISDLIQAQCTPGLVLLLNNLSLINSQTSSSLQLACSQVQQHIKQRITNIFAKQLTAVVLKDIEQTINGICLTVLQPISSKLAPCLYTQSWNSIESFAQTGMNTVRDHLQSLQNALYNPINFKLLFRSCFEMLVSLYFQKIILQVKKQISLNFQSNILKLKPSKDSLKFLKKTQTVFKFLQRDCKFAAQFIRVQLKNYFTKATLSRLQGIIAGLQSLFGPTKEAELALIQLSEMKPQLGEALKESLQFLRNDIAR